MGTRSDFYVGRGPQAEWLGSKPFDGWPAGQPDALRQAKTEPEYRRAVEEMLQTERNCTRPEDGWPWPWHDSGTTDYAYAFDGGQVWASYFGGKWFPADGPDPVGDADEPKVARFPDMTARKNVTFGPRSGLIVVGAEGIIR